MEWPKLGRSSCLPNLLPGRDFLAYPRRGQLERFVDVDIDLGHASRGVTQERGDRQLGEAEVASDAAEGMPQGVGCDSLDLSRGAEARQAALRRREMAVADIGGEDIRAALAGWLTGRELRR
jgi:hypothetical protein